LPTYRNDTGHRITFPDKSYMHWQPGEAKALRFFVPYEDLGLTLADPEPYVLRPGTGGNDYNEMEITPATALADRTWKLPYHETVAVSVFVKEGRVLMTLGDCLDPVAVDPDNNHVGHYAWDRSAYLTFALDPDYPEITEQKVYMKCEPFSFKGSRKEMA
jgi:hypothetical protein